ncbi:phage tail protein [Sorangium sp. So ce726]|uniref:phage tail protein n=1 Tax=Sorangium sp. So ce726 TaxID=3133319 RepID=UPI003F63CCE1
MSEGSSGYLRFLPAIYAKPGPGGAPSFLQRYLQIAEALLGRRDATASGVQDGLAQLLDVLPSLLSPRLSFLFPGSTAALPPILVKNKDGSPNAAATAANLRRLNDYVAAVPIAGTSQDGGPWEDGVEEWLAGFLGWLAGWLEFQRDPAWDVDQQRAALAVLMLLYRARGTRAGMEAMVKLFFTEDIRIIDLAEATPLALGLNSTLAGSYESGDGVLDGRRPYSFAVEIVLPTSDLGSPDVVALQRAVTALVDAEKPLQTRYVVRTGTTFTIGKYSTIGRDTRIPKSETSP